MSITCREIAELTDREQQQMRRWSHNILTDVAARKRRKATRRARDLEEEAARLAREAGR